MKQTAVEFLFKEMERMQYFIGNDIYNAYKEAKEMEKEQIVKSWHNGYDNQSPMIDEDNCGEEYYNQTYTICHDYSKICDKKTI